MTGLFFCLASAEGAGLLFCPAVIQPHKSVYSVFCAVHASYTARATKQRTELYRGFTRDYARSTAHDIRPTQADIIPPAQCWSVSQRPDGLHRYQILPPLRTLHSSAQPPYYNKVYKGAPPVMDPCQTVQQIADHASPAHLLRGAAPPPVQGQPGGVSMLPTPGGLRSGTGQRSGRTSWHFLPGGAVQQQGCGGRRGTIGGSRRSSFRAFAR